MADGWHYSVQGNRHGPVAAAELKRLADAGKLSPTDLVWKEGLASWVAASSVKGLFTGSPTPPPLPPNGLASPGADDLKPKAEAAVKATAEAARAAVQSIRAAKPIAGFHIQRVAFGVAAILGALATFMPWATLPIVGTIYGTAGDGWITLVLFLPAVVLAFLGDRQAVVDGWKQFVVAVPAAIASLIGISKIVSFNSKMSEMNANMAGNPFARALTMTVQVRFGLYLIVLAGVATAVAVFLLKRNSQKPVDL